MLWHRLLLPNLQPQKLRNVHAFFRAFRNAASSSKSYPSSHQASRLMRRSTVLCRSPRGRNITMTNLKMNLSSRTMRRQAFEPEYKTTKQERLSLLNTAQHSLPGSPELQKAPGKRCALSAVDRDSSRRAIWSGTVGLTSKSGWQHMKLQQGSLCDDYFRYRSIKWPFLLCL